MRGLAAFLLVLGLVLPAAARAESSATKQLGTQVGPLQNLTSQIVSGRIQEVEGRFLKGIAGNIEEMSRLGNDARRRNDSIAASCVEQKLIPAQNLRSAAAKAAARLRAIPASDIEGLTSEVRSLSTAADRIGELTTQARACLRINSGQIVTAVELTPDTDLETQNSKPEEKLADLIVPGRPFATPNN